jgi:pimeloyl-ACP methyl ester carboxylesterase
VYQEFPSPANVQNLAGDAIGALRTLSARKDVDPARIGLVGASQAGWIIPRVAARSPLVKFAVVTSGPAVSVGEQGLYAGLTGQGTNNPTQAQIDQQLAGAAPTGFDPRPDLEKLSIPTLWLYGREDKVVYAPQSVEILQALPTPPEIKVFPGAGHFVLDTPHGLNSELTSARRFATGYFTTIRDWLKAR